MRVVVGNVTYEGCWECRYFDCGVCSLKDPEIEVLDSMVVCDSGEQRIHQPERRSPYGWDDAPAWARWAATDADGTMHWFEHKPSLHRDVWTAAGGRYLRTYGRQVFQDSLEERP